MSTNMFLPFRARGTGLPLFCFPHAGGGASVFREWPDLFEPAVDVRPVQLPGRENLLSEQPLTAWPELVTRLADALGGELTGRYALFGHSMGALVAAELAAWMTATGAPPSLVVVSGRGGEVEAPVDGRDWRTASDDDVLAHLLAYGGTHEAVLADPQLRELMAGVMRADNVLCAGYVPGFRRLTVPVLALGGIDDPLVRQAEIELWRDRTTAGCTVEMLPGDHFFPYREAGSVVRAILAHPAVAR
jgi:surfactin synthase thioesterase subunit